MTKLLILDADQRSALAATRSLGRRGIHVVVAGETEKTLSGSSRYSKESFTYPSPCIDPDAFIATLTREVSSREIDILCPMTEITTSLILKYRDKFSDIHIPFCSFDTFELLTNKHRLFNLAQLLHVPIPVTYYISNPGDLNTIDLTLPFPVVLKPYRSRILWNSRWISASVKYANSFEEIRKKVEEDEAFNNHPFLIQEWIQGQGQGIFALYDHGTPLAFFAHRRLREKPPSGGISVLSESVELDPRMYEIAKNILDYVQWHGVAMVEFKLSRTGKPYLMEINARFWGSLQLAIDAGVDFPYLLYALASGNAVRVHGYKIGVKSRWLLGDLDHLYLRFKTCDDGAVRSVPETSKWWALIQFFRFFEKNTRYEVNRWSDIRPFLFELKAYLMGDEK